MGSSPSVGYKVDGGSEVSIGSGSSLSNKTVSSEFGYYNADLSAYSKLSFSVIYHFDFSSYSSSFYSEIYQKMSDDAFDFVFSVWYA